MEQRCNVIRYSAGGQTSRKMNRVEDGNGWIEEEETF